MFVSFAQQTARAEDFVHAGFAADLLPEARGPGSSSAHCGENLHGHTSILSSERDADGTVFQRTLTD